MPCTQLWSQRPRLNWHTQGFPAKAWAGMVCPILERQPHQLHEELVGPLPGAVVAAAVTRHAHAAEPGLLVAADRRLVVGVHGEDDAVVPALLEQVVGQRDHGVSA